MIIYTMIGKQISRHKQHQLMAILKKDYFPGKALDLS